MCSYVCTNCRLNACYAMLDDVRLSLSDALAKIDADDADDGVSEGSDDEDNDDNKYKASTLAEENAEREYKMSLS